MWKWAHVLVASFGSFFLVCLLIDLVPDGNVSVEARGAHDLTAGSVIWMLIVAASMTASGLRSFIREEE